MLTEGYPQKDPAQIKNSASLTVQIDGTVVAEIVIILTAVGVDATKDNKTSLEQMVASVDQVSKQFDRQSYWRASAKSSLAI